MFRMHNELASETDYFKVKICQKKDLLIIHGIISYDTMYY